MLAFLLQQHVKMRVLWVVFGFFCEGEYGFFISFYQVDERVLVKNKKAGNAKIAMCALHGLGQRFQVIRSDVRG